MNVLTYSEGYKSLEELSKRDTEFDCPCLMDYRGRPRKGRIFKRISQTLISITFHNHTSIICPNNTIFYGHIGEYPNYKHEFNIEAKDTFLKKLFKYEHEKKEYHASEVVKIEWIGRKSYYWFTLEDIIPQKDENSTYWGVIEGVIVNSL